MEKFLDVILGQYFTKGVLLFICIALAFSLTARAQKNKVLGKTVKKVTETWQGFLRYASESTEKRIKEEERLQREQGNREKKNLFYRMDEILICTGIRKKLPFLTVELLILIFAILFLVVLVVVTELLGSIILGVAICGFLVLLLQMIFKMLIRMRQSKIEDSILNFANLLENYSRTSDDIVSIFHKISIYLEEPLKSAIEKCYVETYTTGDFAAACNHLDVSIGNRYFSDMLANIEICSRHRANYEEVIHGNKEIIRRYLAERDVQKEIVNQARLEIGLMLILGGWTLFFLADMISVKVMQLLFGSTLGNIAIASVVLVALHAVYTMISIGGEED